MAATAPIGPFCSMLSVTLEPVPSGTTSCRRDRPHPRSLGLPGEVPTVHDLGHLPRRLRQLGLTDLGPRADLERSVVEALDAVDRRGPLGPTSDVEEHLPDRLGAARRCVWWSRSVCSCTKRYTRPPSRRRRIAAPNFMAGCRPVRTANVPLPPRSRRSPLQPLRLRTRQPACSMARPRSHSLGVVLRRLR